ILGGMLEGHLGAGIAFELGVLRRPMTDRIIYTTFPANGPSVTSIYNYTAVDAWEFPVLLKYSLPGVWPRARWRPYIEAGPSFRTQENANGVEPSRAGISAGAGLALQLWKLRVSPGLRYTRWEHESIYPRYATKQDQVEFLTSIAYETNADSRRFA